MLYEGCTDGSIQAALIFGRGSFKVVRAEREIMFYKQAPPPECLSTFSPQGLH